MEAKSVYFTSNGTDYLLELSDSGQVEVLARGNSKTYFKDSDISQVTPVLQKMAKEKGLTSSKEGRKLAEELVVNYGNDLIAGRAKMHFTTSWVDIYHYTPVSNRIEVLRGIAERISFKYDTDWDTNTLGAKLIEFL